MHTIQRARVHRASWIRSTGLSILLLGVAMGCGENDVIGSGGDQGDAGDASTTGDESGSASAGESGSASADAGESNDTTGDDGPISCGLEPGALPYEEGAYIPQGESRTATRDFCTGGMHAIAGAADSVLGVTLNDWPDQELARVRIENMLGDPLSDWSTLAPGGTVSISPPLSGEVLVRIEPEDPEADAHDYTLSVACVEGCDFEYTRYPVLLMHGMAGTETYINVLDYWFQLEEVVLPPGFNVQIRVVDAFQSTEVRAQQWLAHVDAMVAAGIGRKFNLIGHSQGGLDARLVTASPEALGRVESVVTIAAPHLGTPAAEVLDGTFDAFP
ncbi:MAG: esterase/lipase family protein, partial [Nannocystaceae bacterium]